MRVASKMQTTTVSTVAREHYPEHGFLALEPAWGSQRTSVWAPSGPTCLDVLMGVGNGGDRTCLHLAQRFPENRHDV